MPYAVTHILVPIFIVSLIRDYLLKKEQKRKFPLHYVLIVGFAGALPDADILVAWLINLFKAVPMEAVHRTFTHSIFFPLIFLVLALATLKINIKWLRKHKLNLGMVFFMFFVGTTIHILLDATIAGLIFPFYPFSQMTFGLDLLGKTISSPMIKGNILMVIDGIFLFAYLAYLELKHKISDFI